MSHCQTLMIEHIVNSTTLPIQVEKTADRTIVRYPQDFYRREQVQEAAQKLHRDFRWNVTDEGALSVLELEAKAEESDPLIRELFARINGYPVFTDIDPNAFTAAGHPFISCVILLTANDLFVCHHLIPSILRNSRNYEIEILIVYNGFGADLSRFHAFDVSSSELLCVAKGYNQGARRAKGRYLAIFHDDCLVADPDWIPKCLHALDNGALAVTPEIQHLSRFGPDAPPLLLAKNVPLVIRRDNFLELGGYDEHYYIGYEDLDFTYRLLAGGVTFSRVDMQYAHLNGMSTILLFGSHFEEFKTLFAYHLLPAGVIRQLREFYLSHFISSHKEAQLIEQQSLGYFLAKFERYWANTDNQHAIALQSRLAPLLNWLELFPVLRSREAMMNFVEQTIPGNASQYRSTSS